MHKGMWKLPRHGELPKVLPQPTYIYGRTTKTFLEMKDYSAGKPNIGRSFKPLRMSWPLGRPHHTNGWVNEGPRCSATSERQTFHICIQNINISRDRVLQHWKGAPQSSVGLEWLHHYVFGSKIKVQTDHKPIIPIWKKSMAAGSLQI